MKSLAFIVGIVCILVYPVFAFDDCSIIARHSTNTSITKIYSCKNSIISLTGDKSDRQEFDNYWFGEKVDFGNPTVKVDKTFTSCKIAQGRGCGNCDGYMTERVGFDCSQGSIILNGYWGEEFQGHWDYHLELGEVDAAPKWTNSPPEIMHFTSSFQKWCQTKNGYRLCGWADQPEIDHGTPPIFKR